MSRDGSGVYSKPFPDVSSGTSIASAMFNGTINDLVTDANNARPIVAGGTGANNAATARYNMAAAQAAQVVTNFDTQVWQPGTFYAAGTATNSPVAGHAFSGIAYIGEALANPPTNQNVVVEARDATDGKLYIRTKAAGTWGAWILDGDLSGVNTAIAAKVAKAGDTMTGLLVLSGDPSNVLGAVTKQYADAISTAALAAASSANTNANGRVSKGGDTMTGLLVLSADPSAALGAATKQYVDALVRVRYDTAQSLTSGQRSQARDNISAPLRGQIAGLTLSTAGASVSFGIAIGEAADSTAVDLMKLASAYTKTTSAWAVGSGNGSLDTGSVSANTGYHVFLIKRPDTGVVDVLTSLSATAPTLPTNYTLFRRIGWMRTDGTSQWRQFIQNGDEFSWVTPPVDINNTTQGTTPTLYAMTVPTGIKVLARVMGYFCGGASPTFLLLQSPDEASNTPNTPNGNITGVNTSTTEAFAVSIDLWTDTSGQIRASANRTLSVSFIFVTKGWRDNRGKFD